MSKTLYVFFCLAAFFLCSGAHAQKPLWARGNTGGGMDSWPVATDNNGNVFAAGFIYDFRDAYFGNVQVVSTGIYTQAVLVKYDPNGNVLWAKTPAGGASYVLGIATDNSGNAFMLGELSSASITVGTVTLTNASYPASQYFLVKYDPAGNVQWAKTEGGAINYIVSSITYILGCGGVAADDAGNVYITSCFKQPSINVGATTLTNADASGGTCDIVVAKYDGSGNSIWARKAGGIKDDYSFGITVTPSGYVYIAGSSFSPAIAFGPSVILNTGTWQQGYIARFDAAGNPIWSSGSGGSMGVDAIGVASDADNNVYLTGGFKDNSISFNGSTINNPTPSHSSLYLVKFKSSNAVEWTKTISSAGPPATDTGVCGFSIAMSRCGVIWVSGVMHDSIRIESHILRVPSNSPDPIFIAGYNISGTYAGSVAVQSGGDDQSGIACDRSGNIFLCSDYIPKYPFVAGNDVLPSADAGELMYVMKFPYINIETEQFKTSERNMCLNGGITLGAPSGYGNYIWQDGSKETSYQATDTGVFWVYSYDSCASSQTDTFKVNNGCDCGDELFVPNAFTPNGDGQDDVFYPRCGFNITQVSTFRVYNRWGELIFERERLAPNDKSNAWDGTFKGDKPLPDVYVWIADIVCKNGKLINKKGSITVIR